MLQFGRCIKIFALVVFGFHETLSFSYWHDIYKFSSLHIQKKWVLKHQNSRHSPLLLWKRMSPCASRILSSTSIQFSVSFVSARLLTNLIFHVFLFLLTVSQDGWLDEDFVPLIFIMYILLLRNSLIPIPLDSLLSAALNCHMTF